MRRAAAWIAVLAAALCAASAACGKKGPPLAPLHLVPSPVTDLSARRVGDSARIRFVLPTKNANGPGRLELDHIEVFAVTVAPGAPTPPNRELLTKTYLVGEIAVKPVPEEGQPPVEEEDKRPEPGTAVTFDEELTAAKLTPAILKPPPPKVPTTPAQATAVAETAVALAKAPTDPVRVYAVRGVTRRGHQGPPSARAEIPLIALPSPPAELSARFTETAVVVEWKPVEPTVSGYNVYRVGEPLQPVNAEPVSTASFEQAFTEFGKPHCFGVRSVVKSGAASVEGDLSEEKCVTPVDTFAPAAPKGLAVVPVPGQISLIWDANAEKDLAGYLVLRSEAPDAPLQAITPSPIRETSYRDTTVTPGTRYFYAIVAVDTATPPNRSPESARVEETAR